MTSWDEIRRWRVDRRKELTLLRRRVRLQKRHIVRRSVIETLRQILSSRPVSPKVVAGYWPIKGEIDLSALMKELADADVTLALPVVVGEAQPLEFWRWAPGMRMEKGVWNIPVPATRDPVRPDTIIVPLVGFDADCYRLGNGGGYYDRTLGALDYKPFVIGTGYAFSGVHTIFPQPHDIAMDMIVTEDETFSRDAVRLAGAVGGSMIVELASSPCSMSGMDPTYFGCASVEESLGLLAALLQLERRCAEHAAEQMLFGAEATRKKAFADQVYLSIRACSILKCAAKRLQRAHPEADAALSACDATAQSPSDETVTGLVAWRERIGQRIRAALPTIADEELYRDIAKVLRIEERALLSLAERSPRLTPVPGPGWRDAV